ncbi:Uncharacterised protein [Vibrio owensii]|uniref:hypothetical protein n=1 Tax=Vibrio owensii TaxID=696485 RepID=UPI0005769762|nr:hypothetical protein [Vibrio owensii]SUQ02029.1 Uncharacterised protein [Vibrio owensii]
MNGKVFDNWQKLRKKGCLNWLFRTTFVTAILYIIFNVIFLYPSSDAASITIFLSDKALNYSIYTIGMFFAFWAIWLYNESSYEKEVKRRNVA